MAQLTELLVELEVQLTELLVEPLEKIMETSTVVNMEGKLQQCKLIIYLTYYTYIISSSSCHVGVYQLSLDLAIIAKEGGSANN